MLPAQRTRAMAATTVRVCALCARPLQRAGRLCKRCAVACERQARAEKERDYLANWLSTRDDDLSVLAERLRAKARAHGVDWFHPPTPMLWRDRLEQVIEEALCMATENAPVRGNAGQQAA